MLLNISFVAFVSACIAEQKFENYVAHHTQFFAQRATLDEKIGADIILVFLTLRVSLSSGTK